MARKNVTVRLMGLVVTVRRDVEWQEWCVKIKSGRIVLSSYHTDDYGDARNTAAWEIKRLRARASAFDAAARARVSAPA